MVSSSKSSSEIEYDRKGDLKAFDESKLGVKGLVDAGVTTLPRIFVNQEATAPSRESEVVYTTSDNPHVNIPVIDLSGVVEDGGDLEKRREVMKAVSEACEKWGFFQAVNHGVPTHVLDEMINGAKRFHELDVESKKEYYMVRGVNSGRKFSYTSNMYLYTGKVTNWRDTTIAGMEPMPDPQDFPETCREITIEYAKHMKKVALTFLELISEAMGVESNYLKDMDCCQEFLHLTHYYPPCPQPELAIGINQHADNDIVTLLLQDEIGGLQVLHDNQWHDIPHIPGAVIINTGDLLQLISNDKYKSVIHRVQSKKVGPRISVPCFFRPKTNNPRILAPIKELLSPENPAIYRPTTTGEYIAHYHSTGQDYGVKPALDHFKLAN
ncbi:hypothetical protein SOVF_161020 [Spinacia oleracea]|uniref:1-aminocyclopropane-1-carboxylate oxidase homolog 1 n=1 Tax=Spinacia oleracea TaxID=3562 RepID=A0A9R0IC88_SPIOL|nr:1-aminocyclopropane-1-carboxylate oxidase homolog 1-like [Spinacia oleracea]KNA08616.1 hypothetical protein SOVF_161020 [Spinacia oleracea]